MKNIINKISIAVAVLLCSINIAAKTKIPFWHSMAGPLGVTLQTIVADYNQSQTHYEIVPVYKGNYHESLTNTIAAFRAKKHPAIVQIYEVGSVTMMYPAGVIVPVHELLQRYPNTVEVDDFLPPIRGYYSDEQHRLLAMPFNSSSTVLYYNKQAFQRAGLDDNAPPMTWPEVERMSNKLLAAGYRCGFTTTWPSGILIENFSAWHNSPIATLDNGFAGLDAKLLLNNNLLVRYIDTMQAWRQQGIYVYGGRADDALSLFVSGTCPMMLSSSGSHAEMRRSSRFDVGVSSLPYWPDVLGAPQNSVIGGAALWVLTGHSNEVYAGVTDFFSFISQPELQAYWEQETGYVALGFQAYALSKQQGYYEQHPGAEIAIKQLLNKPPTQYSLGSRLGNFPRIRDVIAEELEMVWSGEKTAVQALTDATEYGDYLIMRFKANLDD